MLNKHLRKRILEMGLKHKHGHYGSSMSALDTVKFLYDKVLREGDMFIMSKGHGAPALHVVLEERGIPVKWTIHLEYDERNGVMATSGSLGLGLTTALGRAYAKKIKGEKGRVYCMVGDGEMQEGVVWEALNIANRFKVHNLITLVDCNGYQAISSTKEIMGEDYSTIKRKLEAFGCFVTEIKGHSNKSLEKLLHLPKEKLNGVILHTQKGKGIPVLERNRSFHVYYFHEHTNEYKEAIENLK